MTFYMKPLSYDPARIKGMSERLIVSHYENNYGGAVKRLNLIEEKLAELNYEQRIRLSHQWSQARTTHRDELHDFARVIFRWAGQPERARNNFARRYHPRFWFV